MITRGTDHELSSLVSLLQMAGLHRVKHKKMQVGAALSPRARALAQLHWAYGIGSWRASVCVRRTTSLKAKCRSPRFDPLVHHACSCDDNSVHEVALTVTTALNARSAGPDCSPSRHKIVDEFRSAHHRTDGGVGATNCNSLTYSRSSAVRQFDLQLVRDTLIQTATSLCGAKRGVIFRRDGDLYRAAAFYNATPELIEFVRSHPIVPGRHTITARVGLERRVIHVADLQEDAEYTYALRDTEQIRTELGVPMFRGDDLSVSSSCTN